MPDRRIDGRPDGRSDGRSDGRPDGRPDGQLSALADKILSGPTALDAVSGELDVLGNRLDRKVRADPENVERGLAQLVLTLVELLRQLMERQAVRRVEGGSLTDEEIERLGLTFLRLEERMAELKEAFGLEDADLNLDLGPLGRLL